jgi:hypothetical protein
MIYPSDSGEFIPTPATLSLPGLRSSPVEDEGFDHLNEDFDDFGGGGILLSSIQH